MQNKGALKFLAIMLAIACAFQLSFTFVTRNIQNKVDKMSAEDGQAHIDSIKSQVVYNLGLVKYTYAECLEREINLGLDLRGGMNVTLEVAVEDVVRALAGPNSGDAALNKALSDARKAQANSREDFLTLFAEAYNRDNPTGRLAVIFGTADLREDILPNSTNEEVLRVLRKESESAINNSFNIIKNRIDRFGVVQPNIQRLDNSGRILVELPGVKEPERVRKLLQGSANLEFWTVYTAQEMIPMMVEADKFISTLNKAEAEKNNSLTNGTANDSELTTSALQTPQEKEVATTALETALEVDTTEGNIVDALTATATTAEGDELQATQEDGMHGLFRVLQPYQEHTPVVGTAHSYDTVAVNRYLNLPQVKSLFPRDVKFMWSVKEITGRGMMPGNGMFELYAIKGSSDGKAPLDGGAVVNADAQHAQQGSAAEVSMTMNSAGAKTWARLTRDNKERFIAIVLDDHVYSSPRVNNEITGGRSSITGDFTIQEATDLATVLKSGKMPAPARIVQESIVGPTLGQESINSGVTSFIFAFLLVLVYMIFFYSRGGLVASIALITNLFFLFGVLVSFGAVLTLPGIAGIVLTMAMAVDANIIIFERIKEELRLGKNITTSLRDGFKHAYSAIIDVNMTSLLTGIVLYMFGSGPVQGFATTFIIGIITSVFCSVFITRLIFEGLLTKEWKLTFSTKLTENFLTKTKINFIGFRKAIYVVSIISVIIMVVSLATRGLHYGIDFTGGRTYVVRFDKEITANQVRESLSHVFEDDCVVKQYGARELKQMSITTQHKYNNDDPEVTHEINEMMHAALKPMYEKDITLDDFTTTTDSPLGIISAQKVNASIAHDIVVNSFIAVIAALVIIGSYIAFRFRRWQFGVGGMVSLTHDAILTVGLFSLFHSVMPFNLTVDQSFIAAILTVIGYSVNDTVIIFDRIRENLKLFPNRPLKDNMNISMNQTLARTVNTAGSTVVVLLAIFIFGGEVIRGFIFAMMVGIFLGSISSIFVSTPIAYDLLTYSEKKRLKKEGLSK